MHADRLRRLRFRYLLAVGLPVSALAQEGCHETLPAGATTAGAESSSVASATTIERAPEFESKSVAPLPYAGNDCPRTLTRCMSGQADAGYPAPFPECAPEYTGEYYARSRFSARETTRARRKEPNVCCYRVERPCNYDMPVIGRVLRDEGVPRVTPTCARDGWGASIDALRSVPADVRAVLVEHWAGEAAAEHASVAAFSMIALQLLGFGAPAALVEATHVAALDEVEHARVSYAIASGLAGGTLGPAPLPMPRASSFRPSLESFALDTLVDGCVGETVAALVARESAARSSDPVVARVLSRIADDEERHAELAHRMLAWALACDAALVVPLRRALHAIAITGARDVAGPLQAYGALSVETRAAVRDRAIEHVVRPCVEAMLVRAGITAP